jgi:hypothetical protein
MKGTLQIPAARTPFLPGPVDRQRKNEGTFPLTGCGKEERVIRGVGNILTYIVFSFFTTNRDNQQ